jgi:hypothetical protein
MKLISINLTYAEHYLHYSTHLNNTQPYIKIETSNTCKYM